MSHKRESMEGSMMNAEVEKLANKLAQPWPEYVWSMNYQMKYFSFHISKRGDEYYWYIAGPNEMESGGEAPTLAEAAATVAARIVEGKAEEA